MPKSNGSRFIAHETMAPAELARSPVGTSALYFIAGVEGLKPSEVMQKVQSQLKSYCTRAGSRCELHLGRFMTGLGSVDSDISVLNGVMAVITQSATADSDSAKRTQLAADTAPGTPVTFTTANYPDTLRKGEFVRFATPKAVIVRTAGGEKRIPAIRVQRADGD